MSLIGDSKEEDREIFRFLKDEQTKRRYARASEAHAHLESVRLLVDDGRVTIDPNGTWNWKLKGRGGQYWGTKGRWHWNKKSYGGGILKFVAWLEREQ